MQTTSAAAASKYAKYWTPDGLHHASKLRIYGFNLNNVATNMYFFLMAYALWTVNRTAGFYSSFPFHYFPVIPHFCLVL